RPPFRRSGQSRWKPSAGRACQRLDANPTSSGTPLPRRVIGLTLALDTWRIVPAEGHWLEPGKLRERRLALRLSQAELSRVFGVTRNSVARWERGDLPIRHRELVALALDNLANQRSAPADIDARDKPTLHHNLPAQLSSFVGRQQDLSELVRLLTTARMVTIVG